MSEKVMVFSHDDLDGVMAPIILGYFLNDAKETKVDVKHCKTGTYGTIDAEITKFIKSQDATTYDMVFVTDLAPSEAVMADLDAFSRETKIPYEVFDHHQTAGFLMELYPENVQVYPRIDGRLTSATSVVFHHFTNWMPEDYFGPDSFRPDPKLKRVAEFASIVRSWDCWDWTNDANDRWGELASDFNSLLHILGTERFLARFIEPDFWSPAQASVFSDTDILLLDIERSARKKYIQAHVERTQFQVLELDKPYHVAYVTAESYKSMLGNAMCKLTHPRTKELVDFAIISDNGYLSLRSIGDMNVADIVKTYFNGGGHANAAGGFVPFDTFPIIGKAAKKAAKVAVAQ